MEEARRLVAARIVGLKGREAEVVAVGEIVPRLGGGEMWGHDLYDRPRGCDPVHLPQGLVGTIQVLEDVLAENALESSLFKGPGVDVEVVDDVRPGVCVFIDVQGSGNANLAAADAQDGRTAVRRIAGLIGCRRMGVHSPSGGAGYLLEKDLYSL